MLNSALYKPDFCMIFLGNFKSFKELNFECTHSIDCILLARGVSVLKNIPPCRVVSFWVQIHHDLRQSPDFINAAQV